MKKEKQVVEKPFDPRIRVAISLHALLLLQRNSLEGGNHQGQVLLLQNLKQQLIANSAAFAQKAKGVPVAGRHKYPGTKRKNGNRPVRLGDNHIRYL